MAPIRRIAIMGSGSGTRQRMKAGRMTFPRRAQRQALHGTAVGVSEHRRPMRVGGQLVSTHQHAGTDVRFGDPLTGLHTTMMAAAAAAGVGAVLALVVRHVENAGTVVPTLPERKPDASLAELAETGGLVGARSSRHGEGW